MSLALTEARLVEQPAIQLFAGLGWSTISAMEDVVGPTGTLRRETKSEVVRVPRLRSTLERLNPGLPSDAIPSARDELACDRSAMSLSAANRKVWELLRNRVKVSVPDRERGGQTAEKDAGAVIEEVE